MFVIITRVAIYISGLENKNKYESSKIALLFSKIFPIRIYTLLHAFESIVEALLSPWLIDFFKRLTNWLWSNANKFFLTVKYSCNIECMLRLSQSHDRSHDFNTRVAKSWNIKGNKRAFQVRSGLILWSGQLWPVLPLFG